MDCELFDKLVIDRVFSELDDLVSGAVQRHVAHCSRCRSIESGLRAAREVTHLPFVPPPASFVDQVLALERATRTQLPWRQRVGRAVSVLAGYAMRPQLGMSALLLLMIGLSLFLLRTQPGEHELIHVTERGVPEGDLDPRADSTPNGNAAGPENVSVRVATSASAQLDGPSSPAAAPHDALTTARRAFDNGRYELAEQLAEKSQQETPGNDASAGMLRANARSRRLGCQTALSDFASLRSRFANTRVGDEATFRAAECHRELGASDKARELYLELLNNATWGAEAKNRLGQLPTDRSDDGGTAPAPP